MVDTAVKSAIKIAGVGADWEPYLKWIINKESGGNPTAQNKTSSAYGLMQFLDKTWKNYGGKTSDPVKQVVAGIKYIKDRYSTPQVAVAFHQKNNWY